GSMESTSQTGLLRETRGHAVPAETTRWRSQKTTSDAIRENYQANHRNQPQRRARRPAVLKRATIRKNRQK
ncbi:hypothetical protein MMC31_007156, partial [Peltigera leucophlebia]|nr:hypothetical protein [Peltigera leucophlebia]